MGIPRKTFSIFTAAGLLLQAAAPVMAQQSGQTGRNEARIQVTSELVLVNVVAHDKKGNLVRDLKKGDFKPEHAGKMNFYCSAVDDLLRHEHDQLTVGLILCQRSKFATRESIRSRQHTRRVRFPNGRGDHERYYSNRRFNRISREPA